MGGTKTSRESERVDGLGPTAAEEGLKWEFFDLDFSVHKSRRYHEKLWSFYSSWRDWFRIVTAVTGSSAFVFVVADVRIVGELLTGFVALWAVLDIIVAPDKKADLHSDLSKRFTVLAERIANAEICSQSLQKLTAERLMIEEKEPPCKRLVDLEARNDEWRARGYDLAEEVPLSDRQRRYFTFGLPRLERWKAERKEASAPHTETSPAGG
jgi:hypothetical protein